MPTSVSSKPIQLLHSEPAPALTLADTLPATEKETDQSPQEPKSRQLRKGPDAPIKPTILPVEPASLSNELSRHFKVGPVKFLTSEYDTLSLKMARLQRKQPVFRDFVNAQIEQAFPQLKPLDPDMLSFERSRLGDDGRTSVAVSKEPLLDALTRAIQEIHAYPDKPFTDEPGVTSQFMLKTTPTEAARPITAADSLHTIARRIATQFPETVKNFWTQPNPKEILKDAPQDQLLSLHKKQLSTLAALGEQDGYLSSQAKRLVDTVLQYPTREERNQALAPESRPGIYPLVINDNSASGARLAGAWLVTSKEGSAPGNDDGPVVLCTPSEGLEPFENSAQAFQALAQRLDARGTAATLLEEGLPLSAQKTQSPLQGQDLIASFVPIEGDVIAEGFTQLLKRQADEVQATLMQTLSTENQVLHPMPLQDADIGAAIDDAADWSTQVDGNNAMLARYERLADKKQPQWLKNLTSSQIRGYQYLDRVEQKSVERLAPMLEKIPTLHQFANQQLNLALQKKYPGANIDAQKTTVVTTTKSRVHTRFRHGAYTPANYQTKVLSLTDLSLKNPTAFPAGDSNEHVQDTLQSKLLDAQGKPVLDSDGTPIVLKTAELLALVEDADVGGKYLDRLQSQLAPDASTGEPHKLRSAWKHALRSTMNKHAYLAKLSPTAYTASETDSAGKSLAPQWVRAVIDYPDPATRPKVDGKTVIANTMSFYGAPIQGVTVLSDQEHSSRVLYSPEAPDGIAWRALASQQELETLMAKPEWKAYARARTHSTPMESLQKTVKDYRDKNIIGTLENVQKALEPKIAYLTAIDGNLRDAMYQQVSDILLKNADLSSISNAEVSKESRYNKMMFGIELAGIFLDIVPIIGKGVSVASRLARAGLKIMRMPGNSLGKMLGKPGHLSRAFSDFTVVATGQPIPTVPISRPVFKPTAQAQTLAPGTGTLAVPSGRATRIIPAPPNGAAANQIQLNVPSTSAGTGTLSTASKIRQPPRLPDFSQHAAPQSVLDGTKRADGTFQVGDDFYIPFTDGTGVERAYKISPIYKLESGSVRAIDASSGKQFASLVRTGTGEWRLNKLKGGKPDLPLDDYMDRVLKGSAADDFVDSAETGRLREWFRRDMGEFYDSFSIRPQAPRPEIAPVSADIAPSELIKSTLSRPDVNGWVIGESHEQLASLDFLINNMARFKESGVTTIYLEGGYFLERSPTLAGNAYTADDAQYLGSRYPNDEYGDNTLSAINVLEAAHKNGIKVIGLEHAELTAHVNDLQGFQNSESFYIDRLEEFNYFATKIIENTPKGEKWVALVGNSHMNNYVEPYTGAAVPGIAELTGGLGVSIRDAAKGAASTTSVPAHAHHLTDEMEFWRGDVQIEHNVDKYLKA
ncbi:membrane-targeted effector domain-containing toxin [Pseudomonas poae]|uniref:membrane-targeted effector domain-containing toxin n=1 Tax=Pseudomonas poae TaxID=200451 RepID=UPI0030D0D799